MRVNTEPVWPVCPRVFAAELLWGLSRHVRASHCFAQGDCTTVLVHNQAQSASS